MNAFGLGSAPPASSTPGNVFGRSLGFGSAAAFGHPAAAPSGGLFGAAAPAPAPGGIFCAPASQPASAGFGSAAGGQPPSGGFGGGVFGGAGGGAPAAPAAFGSSPLASGFGQPAGAMHHSARCCDLADVCAVLDKNCKVCAYLVD